MRIFLLLLRKYRNYFFLLVLILLPLWPLGKGDFFRMHDFTHVARLIELDVALKAGQIPPRWAPDFGWGYGMPLFHFYSPLPYYIAEIFYLLKFSAVWSIKLVFGLNFLAGFYFMYLWAKEFWGKWGGLVSATAFTYLPYRAVQFYVRGALAELTAMTFLPLFFYAAYKLVKEKKSKYIILTSLAIAGVFLSHNVIALFSIFFFSLYYFFLLSAKAGDRQKSFIKTSLMLALATIISFGLTAFFILPAFFEKDFTIVETIAQGYSHYSLHFVYLRQFFDRTWAYGGSILGPFDDISFQIGMPHLLLASLSPLVLIKAVKQKFRYLIALLFFTWFAFLFSVFMMTFHSQFLWDKLQFIHIAQFPWRLLSFTGVVVSFLSGSLWLLFNQSLQRLSTLKIYKSFKNKKWPFKAILTALVLILIIGLNFGFFRPEKFSKTSDFYYTDRELIKKQMSDIFFDYLPKTAKKNPPLASSLYDFKQDWAKEVKTKPGYYQLKTVSAKDETFWFNLYYFPGWQAFIDSKKADLQVDPDIGRIGIIIPKGDHEIVLKLAKTSLQFWSDITSLVTLLGLAIFFIKTHFLKNLNE